MNNPSKNTENRQLLDNSLAFFGAITASVTHELNNIIAIINQTAGLLDDLLIGARNGREIPIERLEKIAKSTEIQTNRQIKLIKRMNAFAHSTDEPMREYDICNTVENITALSRRLVDLKNAELETNIPDMPIMITGNPFLLQQVIFLCLKLALTTIQENDIINISVNKIDSNVNIDLGGLRSSRDSDFDLSYLEGLTNSIGGSIKKLEKENRITFNIVIPDRI